MAKNNVEDVRDIVTAETPVDDTVAVSTDDISCVNLGDGDIVTATQGSDKVVMVEEKEDTPMEVDCE